LGLLAQQLKDLSLLGLDFSLGHAKFRAKSGKFKLFETEDHVKLEAVA
jgi:hypothetical protein